MREMKALEAERLEAAAKEAKLSESMMNNKRRLLENMADEGARMELEVRKLQDSRDKQKSLLVDSLSNCKAILNFPSLNSSIEHI